MHAVRAVQPLAPPVGTPEVVPAETLPGPRTPALLQTMAWRFDSPLRLYATYGARYGDAFRLRLLEPSGRTESPRSDAHATLVVLSAPHQLRDVYALSRDDLQVGNAYRFLDWFLGADSLITSDGATHLNEKRLLQAAFGPESLVAYERLTREAAIRAFRRWPAFGTINLASRIADVAQDCTLSLMFGHRDEAARLEIRKLMQRASASSISVATMLLPPLRADYGRWSPGGRVARDRRELAAWLDGEIAWRQAARTRGNDVLGRLLDAYALFERPMEREHLLGEIRLLLGSAAVNTSALAWCCYNVVRDPMARASARAAAEDENSLTARAYLDAVCKESLRLNPPFVGAVRRAAKPTIVGNVLVQPGMYVIPCFYLTHLRPDLYPAPLEFRPERFLESSFSPYEYAPFGAGVRKCLGYAVALRQMQIILGELLRTFDLRPAAAWSGRDCVRDVLLMPRDPLRTHLRRARA